MLPTILLFFLLLFVVFVASILVTKRLYQLLFLLTHSSRLSLQLLTFLFLPGTLLHELSHAFVAELLQVRTGRISFIPEPIDEEKVRLGSLTLASTDPFRSTLIGIGPVVSGLAVLILLVFFLGQTRLFSGLFFLLGYLVFVVANTMFSSAQDLESAAVPAILLFLVGSALWLGGVSLPFPESWSNLSQTLLHRINQALLITALVDLSVWLTTSLVQVFLLSPRSRSKF